ncbi:MAG: TetR/AcrR family transcriptional regulator, partial [Nitrospiraceae bacterium]|nr:TetR/AcrR family transcriptional regulator [Nitrospiraceae bacterium]
MPEATPSRRDGSMAPVARIRPGIEGILEASVAEFFEKGYGGTTVRMIAARAGVTVAALYHHFASKHEVLLTVMRQVMGDLLEGSAEALAGADEDAKARFSAFVANHVSYHVSHLRFGFVANSELRSLEGGSRAEIVALRDEYEQRLVSVVTEGGATGEFQVRDPKLAARAVIAMCTAVSGWFDPRGPMTAEQVKAEVGLLALNL